jgi:hypothetical protein
LLLPGVSRHCAANAGALITKETDVESMMDLCLWLFFTLDNIIWGT